MSKDFWNNFRHGVYGGLLPYIVINNPYFPKKREECPSLTAFLCGLATIILVSYFFARLLAKDDENK